MKKKGLKIKFGGNGLNPSGSGFWSGFKKGFTSVFKPGAQVIGAVATATGNPEIGIPLSVVSGMM
jgi:hypothetical protein